jgi:hypothetical protein
MNSSHSFARLAALVLRPILGEGRPRARHEFRPRWGWGVEGMEDRVVPAITDWNVLPFVPPGNNFAFSPPPNIFSVSQGNFLPKPGHGVEVTSGDTLSTVPFTNTSKDTVAVVLAIYNSPTSEANGPLSGTKAGPNHNLTAQKLAGYEVVILKPGQSTTLSIDVSQLKLNGDAGERGFQAEVVTIDLALAQSVLGKATSLTVTDIDPHDPLVTGDSLGLTSKIGNGNNDFYFGRLYDGEIYNNSPPPL